MSATRIISRAEGGIVPTSHTTARVVRPSQWLLVHYTGGSGPQRNDGRSDAQHMAALQSSAIGAGKTWEYNYVITYPNGWIWEMGGEQQASHCLNANSFSYGVQFNLGIGGDPTPMIDSFRWLRQYLIDNGQIAPGAQVIRCHYSLRTTACPGQTLADPPGARWNSPTGEGSLGNPRPELLVPWVLNPPFPPPPPPGGLFVTPEDKAYIDSKFDNVSARVWGHLLTNAPGTTAVSSERWLTGAGDSAYLANQKLEGLDVASFKAAIVEAATEALTDVTVAVDVEAIATAVADKLAARLVG